MIETSSAMNKDKCGGHCRSRAVFRLLVNVSMNNSTTNLNLHQEQLARTPSPTASSVIHPIGQGDHQKKCPADTQERGSQEAEKQIEETAIQTQTKHTEIGNKESESPFQQKEQSLLRKAIRLLFILLIIFGVIVIFVIASQYVYLEAGHISRSNANNGFVKLRFVGMYNPPT